MPVDRKTLLATLATGEFASESSSVVSSMIFQLAAVVQNYLLNGSRTESAFPDHVTFSWASGSASLTWRIRR